VKAHEILIAIFSSLYPDYGAIGIPDENSMVDLEPLSRESAASQPIFAHWPYSFNLRYRVASLMPKIIAASRRQPRDSLTAATIIRRSTIFRGKNSDISFSRRRSTSTLLSISICASQIDDCFHVPSLKLLHLHQSCSDSIELLVFDVDDSREF
jgi:hypothetical protein